MISCFNVSIISSLFNILVIFFHKFFFHVLFTYILYYESIMFWIQRNNLKHWFIHVQYKQKSVKHHWVQSFQKNHRSMMRIEFKYPTNWQNGWLQIGPTFVTDTISKIFKQKNPLNLKCTKNKGLQTDHQQKAYVINIYK